MNFNYNIEIDNILNKIYKEKIFEYAKLGLPILYFGGGEGEDIVSRYQLGWVARAGDYDFLNLVILSIDKDKIDLKFKEKIKATAFKNFDFNRQLDTLITKL